MMTSRVGTSPRMGSFTAVDVGTFESSRSGFPAENAIDGNLGTRWSSSGEDRDIYVDLGGVARIDDVGIAWFDGNDRVSEFRIYTRTGTSGSWNEVFEGESSGDTAGIEIFNVDDEDARFVRIEVESDDFNGCLLYTSPSPRDRTRSRMPSSA